MKKQLIILVLIFTALNMSAQIKTVKIEKINLPESVSAYQAKFSQDGNTIYFSNSSYDGIWKYSLAEKNLTAITNDRFSGFSYDLDQSGSKISYRRSLLENGERVQEIVEKNIKDNSVIVLDRSNTLTTPVYYSGKVIYSKNKAALNISPNGNEIKILGVEDTKIALLVNGKKEILDPIPGGSYIWPSLSPDGKMIVAYEMSKGTFVCSIDGKIIANLGRKNSPSFTKDSKWIVYMNDKDDGHNIITSDLYAVSLDGKQTVKLTGDAGIIELNPVCSSTENKIVFTSLNGEIFVLSYEETK